MRNIFVAFTMFLTAPAWGEVPVITSFSPSSGIPGISVTLSGSGFSATPASNIVRFGGAGAAVTSAGTNSLVVTVPPGATYAPISVTTGSLTGSSRLPFTPLPAGINPVVGTSFAPSVDFPTGGMMRMGTIADLDGDGKLDLIGTNDNNCLSIFRNMSHAGTISSGSFAPVVNVPTGYRPYFVSAGDIDGDGKLDLAVANNSSGTVSVLKNGSTPGSLSFLNAGEFSAGPVPTAVVITDLDGDGRPDLVVSSNAGGIYVLRNLSASDTIRFAAAWDSTTPDGCGSLAAADIDGDGLPDIVVANGASRISVFRNTSSAGKISFAPALELAGPPGVWSIATGDIDGDGRPDIVAGSNQTSAVSVLRNKGSVGNMSFDPKTDLAPGSLSWNMALGDIDGDGKPELVVPGTLLGTVSVFPNTSHSGSIAFKEPIQFHTGGLSMSVNIGDIDRDGFPDLVIGNFYSGNSISVLRMTTALPRQIFVKPDSLAYGWVRIGARDTLSLTVMNTGNKDSLRIGSLKSTGAQFSVQPGAAVIPPQGSLFLSVVYAPLSVQRDTASVLIGSDDSLNPVISVRLSGRGYKLANAPSFFGITSTQYGQVRIIWFRSVLDTAGAADPVIQYSLWRFVPGSAGLSARPGSDPLRSLAQFDPLWDFVETIPAAGFERYSTLTSVYANYAAASTPNVFMVAAQTKGGSAYLSLPDTAMVQSGQVTGVSGQSGVRSVGGFELDQNYPNPFNPTTTIRYGLPQSSPVTLVVYNTLGQRVATLVEGEQEAGYHEARFDGSGLASGVYLYRIRAGDFVRTRKLLLVR